MVPREGVSPNWGSEQDRADDPDGILQTLSVELPRAVERAPHVAAAVVLDGIATSEARPNRQWVFDAMEYSQAMNGSTFQRALLVLNSSADVSEIARLRSLFALPF